MLLYTWPHFWCQGIDKLIHLICWCSSTIKNTKTKSSVFSYITISHSVRFLPVFILYVEVKKVHWYCMIYRNEYSYIAYQEIWIFVRIVRTFHNVIRSCRIQMYGSVAFRGSGFRSTNIWNNNSHHSKLWQCVQYKINKRLTWFWRQNESVTKRLSKVFGKNIFDCQFILLLHIICQCIATEQSIDSVIIKWYTANIEIGKRMWLSRFCACEIRIIREISCIERITPTWTILPNCPCIIFSYTVYVWCTC